MIEAIVLVSIGAFGALYFTHKTFREKVNDLLSHAKALVIKKPQTTDASPTPATGENPVAYGGGTTVVVTQPPKP